MLRGDRADVIGLSCEMDLGPSSSPLQETLRRHPDDAAETTCEEQQQLMSSLLGSLPMSRTVGEGGIEEPPNQPTSLPSNPPFSLANFKTRHLNSSSSWWR